MVERFPCKACRRPHLQEGISHSCYLGTFDIQGHQRCRVSACGDPEVARLEIRADACHGFSTPQLRVGLAESQEAVASLPGQPSCFSWPGCQEDSERGAQADEGDSSHWHPAGSWRWRRTAGLHLATAAGTPLALPYSRSRSNAQCRVFCTCG